MHSMPEFARGPHLWKPMRRRVEGQQLRNCCRDDEPLGAAEKLLKTGELLGTVATSWGPWVE